MQVQLNCSFQCIVENGFPFFAQHFFGIIFLGFIGSSLKIGPSSPCHKILELPKCDPYVIHGVTHIIHALDNNPSYGASCTPK